jgi:hypothetical protein
MVTVEQDQCLGIRLDPDGHRVILRERATRAACRVAGVAPIQRYLRLGFDPLSERYWRVGTSDLAREPRNDLACGKLSATPVLESEAGSVEQKRIEIIAPDVAELLGQQTAISRAERIEGHATARAPPDPRHTLHPIEMTVPGREDLGIGPSRADMIQGND